MKFWLSLIFGLLLIGTVHAQTLRVETPRQGGTGIGSATVGDVGNCLKVSAASPFTYTLGTCGSGGSSAPNEFTYTIAGGGNYLTPTSTSVGLLTVGSSTISKLVSINSTSTNATSTYLQVSTLATLAKVGIGTTTSDLLAIQGAYPAFRIFNTDSTQFAGAGFYLINSVAGMGNQAGVNHYMGINDAGATQGFYTIDKTNTAGGGTGHLQLFDFNADSISLYTNGAVGARLYPANSQGSIFEITPPTTPNNQEATVATVLKDGSGNNEWVDWTMEDYTTDHQGSINVSRAGTGQVLPFSLRFWDSNRGPVHLNGVYAQTWLPSGLIGFGVSTSTTGTTTNPALLYAASSTATNLLRMDAAPGTQRFLFTTAGVASTTNLTISGLANTVLSCLQVTNQGVVQATGVSCAAAANIPNEFTYTIAGNGNYLTPTSTTVGLLTGASSTISNLVSLNSTSTQATSTYLNVSTRASTSALTVSNSLSFPAGSVTNTFLQNSSITLNTSSPLGGGGAVSLGGNLTLTCTTCLTTSTNVPNEFTYTIATNGNYLTPTSTSVGLLTLSSSTISNLVSLNSTTTQATSTFLSVGTLASTSVLRISGGSTVYERQSTSTIANLVKYAFSFATSSTVIPVMYLDTSNGSKLQIATGTASSTLNVGGTPGTDGIVFPDYTLQTSNGVLIVDDEKTSGTGGGAVQAVGWSTRILNTVVVNTIPGASVASNTVTLPAGTYQIEASAPAFAIYGHKTAWFNTTSSATTTYGTSEYADGTGPTFVGNRSHILYRFAITVSSAFTLKHYFGVTSGSANALGVAASQGTEVYTQVKITRE